MTTALLPAPFRRLDGEPVYERGRITVTVDQVVLPDGSRGEYALVDMGVKFGVTVIPIAFRDGFPWIGLIRQHRYPVKDWVLELPGGGASAIETTEALRELTEETAIIADSIELLATFYENPGLSPITGSAWLARVPAAAMDLAHIEGESGCITEWYTVEEVRRMMVEGRISAGVTLAALGIGFASGKLC
ncbi:NUDIX hydrolase [Arthrobacter methylotrophus]|uniref:NUDIX hydrolase n=1 Tax=Arthrobacter methylotrophus TaxID=121291 RepID=A0ABV5UR60_9MICC